MARVCLYFWSVLSPLVWESLPMLVGGHLLLALIDEATKANPDKVRVE